MRATSTISRDYSRFRDVVQETDLPSRERLLASSHRSNQGVIVKKNVKTASPKELKVVRVKVKSKVRAGQTHTTSPV
jgi:hypothetical protein